MKEPDKIQNLIINGEIFAKYHIDYEMNFLFLKAIPTTKYPKVTNEYEEFLTAIISALEVQEFAGISYLNV